MDHFWIREKRIEIFFPGNKKLSQKSFRKSKCQYFPSFKFFLSIHRYNNLFKRPKNLIRTHSYRLKMSHKHKGFVDLFYDFWIQKSHHFYNFWIQNFFCPFLQFLDPETAVFLWFLDPETAPFLQFVDPEIFWSIFTISGSRNCSIFAVSGSRNCTISAISGSSNEPARMSLLVCYPPMG